MRHITEAEALEAVKRLIWNPSDGRRKASAVPVAYARPQRQKWVQKVTKGTPVRTR
jgi:hypothetical protein